MESLWQDLRISLRQLRTHPGFTILVVLTMALGIGSNTTLFSIVDGILLRPLHYEQAGQLAAIWNRLPGLPALEASFSKPEMVDLREQAKSFAQIGAYGYGASNVATEEGATILWTAWISSNLLSVLGVDPALGRGFAPEDHLQDNKVALIGHGYWTRQMGGEVDVVGKTLRIDQDLYTIVGVMPESFQLPLDFQWAGKTPLILPLLDPKATDEREARFIHVVGRLRAGADWERAQAEMDTFARRLAEGYPGVYPRNGGWHLEVQPLQEVVVGKARPALLLLFAAVGFVLVIACVNLANLLLARAMARGRENAVRLALGVGRRRLLQQLLVESLVLSLLGGAVGLLLAHWGIRLLVALSPGNIPRLEEVAVDGRVLLFALALSVATGLVLGLVPILKSWRPDLQSMLKQGGRAQTVGAREHLLRRLLVVVEVALSLLLLIGAGLTVRSFIKLRQVDVGFNPRGLVEIAVRTPPATYPEDHQVKAYYDELFARVRRLPGVRHVGSANALPFHVSSDRQPVLLEGRLPAPGEPEPTAGVQVMTPDYFRAMQVPLVAGRHFTDQDREAAQPVAIVNAALVRSLASGGEVLGKRLKLPNPSKPDLEPAWRTIVGVVGDVKYTGLDVEATPEVFVPLRQQDFAASNQGRGQFMMVRATGDLGELGGAVRRQVQALDRNLPVSEAWIVENLYSSSMSQPRFTMLLLSLFGTLALFLAAVGIYGVMSFLAEQRRQEMGVRIALGADRSQVFRMLLGEGAALTGLGLALGAVGAFWLTRLLASQMFEVTTGDPLTFLASAVVLTGVALLAVLVPARRATRVDPITVLRQD